MIEQLILMQEIVEFNDFEAKLAEFKSRYDGVIYDLTIPEEEKKARSDKLSVGKVIAELDRAHKKIKAPLAEKVSLIDGERKRIKDDLLNVQKKIKSQIQRHEDKIQAHADMLQSKVDVLTVAYQDLPPEDLQTYINSEDIHYLLIEMKSIVVDDSYENRKADAALAQVDTIKKLESMLEAQVKYENEQAELERLRIEKEERIRIEREEAIRKEAEAKAKCDAERAAQAAIEAAERKTWKAEQAKIKAEEEAKFQAERLAIKAVREERERVERNQRKDKEEQEAIQAKEDAKREKQTYRNKIHNAAMKSFLENGYKNEEAIAILTLIRDKKINNVQFVY